MPKSKIPSRKADQAETPKGGRGGGGGGRGEGSGQPTGRITANPTAPPEPRPTINYILGGPTDDQYQSKHQ